MKTLKLTSLQFPEFVDLKKVKDKNKQGKNLEKYLEILKIEKKVTKMDLFSDLINWNRNGNLFRQLERAY